MIPDMSNFCIYGAVLTSLITTFYLYIKYKHKYWSRKGVYTPPVHWLFGHFKNCIMQRTSSPQMLADMYNSCNESVVGIYIFQKPFLIVRSPEVLKHIFIKDFNFFPNHYFASKRKNDVLGSSNLFSIDNPKWKYLRNKMSPIFTTGKQKHLFNQILKISENFKQYIVDHLDNGKQSTINIKDGASKFTTDVISSLSFGISTNSFEKPEPEFFVRSRTPFILSFRGAIQLFANFFFPKLNDIFGFTFFGKETEYFRKIFSLSMKNREESGYKRGDVIDVMLDIKKEKNPDFEFEDDELLAQSAIILVAGLETSSVTISFALYELAMQPSLQAKIREEIKKKIGDDKLNYEHISEMKYVNQVVSETLRLYPPVPLIDRISVEDYKIPETDIVLDKETAVFASVIGLHTDPKYFTNPFKYDPDRFSDERISDMTPGTYIPFGIGPRTCIGMRTGILMSMVGLITILREYEVSINSNYKCEVNKRSIFTAPLNGVNLYFKRSPIVH
ncbi:PREDICTED: cytochrome P450 6k1-like [Ceratosolen solmsi marchali]|uniref:Cytochrome P450 6k1-like n=1 Tax=Ceratosolen solmsi marchali TaxID=326594 RepID=A0AAJ6YM24_9HYME|nr:PREDICTED: cytochrome P450 6k1-like [Ceratosolen solmsi marchali]